MIEVNGKIVAMVLSNKVVEIRLIKVFIAISFA